MPQRYEYRHQLNPGQLADRPTHLPGELRQPEPADAEQLAQLLLEAYRGTIDDGGETIDDARAEIASYMAGTNNPPLLGCSWLVAQPSQLVSACLICFWRRHESPLVAYVVTHPRYTGQKLGQLVVRQSLASLRQAGYSEVRAVITAGNQPSEQLFSRLGFTHVEEPV